MNKGIDQNSRRPKALDPKNVLLDERTMLDMVRFTLSLSEYVKFYGLHNEVEGSWLDVFKSDPIFSIAQIASLDMETLRKQNETILKSAHSEFDSEITLSFVEDHLKMISSALNWSMSFEQSKYTGSLKRELDQILDSAATYLHEIKQWVYQLGNSVSEKNEFEDLNERIQDQIRQLKLSAEVKSAINDQLEQTNLTEERLFKAFTNTYSSLVFLKEKAAKKFEEELFNYNLHPPHTGLLFTFFKLFDHLRADINTITGKHLKYYYEEMLQLKSKEADPHRALMSVALQAGKKELDISKGEPFEFIFENKTAMIFEAEEASQINKAVIKDIRTLFKGYEPPLSDELLIDSSGPGRIYGTHIYNGEDNSIYKADSSSTKLVSILGDKKETFGDDLRTEEPSIGIVVSSPVFILEKGIQQIRLTFSLTEESYQNTRSYLTHLYHGVHAIGGKSKDESSFNLEWNITSLIRDAFLCYLSCESGWKLIEKATARLIADEPSFELIINLDQDQDMMVPLDSAIHDGDFISEWPCIKLLLNTNTPIYSYDFLSLLIVENLAIRTRVSEVTDFKLSNSIGPLDQSIPFTPFGPLPSVGSFLRIENPLIFHRNLSELYIKLDWSGLPLDRNGFEAYYKMYPYKMDNSSFRCALGLSRNLHRGDQASSQSEELFEATDIGAFVKNERTLKVDLERLTFRDRITLADGEPLPGTTALHLVLVAPEVAFGHHVYNNIYTEAVLKGSRFIRRRVEIPNQPYTPTLEQLVITYSNSVKINMLRKKDEKLSDVKLIHLYPFGHVQVYPGLVKGACSLIPRIEHRGNLLLGLEQAVSGQIVNIGFELQPAKWLHTIFQKPKIHWEYLIDNEWLSLNTYVLEDSTEGLVRSGIVKIEIPETIQLDNTRMPLGKFWIRAVSDDIRSLNSKISAVFAQAVSLISVPANQQTEELQPDQTKVVKIGIDGKVGIDTVLGPFNMEWGDFGEKKLAMYSRIGERMRHHNRGVSHWDFERLVLNRFSEIERIRVYGRNSRPNELVNTSNMQVVVIPKGDPAGKFERRRKEVPCHTIFRIREYLRKFSSPYVHIEVSNPVYEELKVRCRVKFTDVKRRGYLRNKLNQELIRFLSPGNEKSLIPEEFDQSVSKTEILNFIEKRHYVDFVTSFSVLQIVEVMGRYRIIDTARGLRKENEDRAKPIDILRTISAYATLTSAPGHLIEFVEDDETFREPEKSGYGDLFLESDFILSDSEGKYY